MKFGRAKSDAVAETSANGALPVFHARRDFCHDHIVLSEGCVAFSDFAKRSRHNSRDVGVNIVDCFHRDEATSVFRLECVIRRGIDFADFAKFHGWYLHDLAIIPCNPSSSLIAAFSS